MQLRTILMKLMLRGILAPKSASYISSLPPMTPILPHHSLRPGPMPMASGTPMLGFAPRCMNVDGLQAQLDALEAGLSPLTTFDLDQNSASSIDLQVPANGV